MQYTSAILLSAAGLLATVSAHGAISDPPPRVPGEAMKAACGEQMYNNQASDHFGNIQGQLQVASTQTDYNAVACNVWQCKGYQFADVNASNIQSWTAGQVIPFTFQLRAPHAGVANVSIVNTATNQIIGSPLVNYPDFANNAYTTPANQTSFSITIPSDLGSVCATAGACVVQHFWDARSIDQTYESCVDFTVGGSGAAAPAPAAGYTPDSPASAAGPARAPAPAPSTGPVRAAAPAPAAGPAPASAAGPAYPMDPPPPAANVPTTLRAVTRPSATKPATHAGAPAGAAGAAGGATGATGGATGGASDECV